jgi:cell division protein FtsQ
VPRVAGAARKQRTGRWRRLLRRARQLALPLAIVAALGLAVVGLRTPEGRLALQDLDGRLLEASARLGWRIADIEVEGRETTDRDTIIEALGVGLGAPILAVDLAQARQRLEALPWVRAAVIERRLPNTIHVGLVERKPMALWQNDGKVQLIDHNGEIIPVTRLDRFAKLPLVVGPDAAANAADLLAMLDSEPELAARVTAAVRVSGRRWNLRIDNAIDVLLPAEDPAAAWGELARLERSSALLKREVQAVDLRLSDRLVLKLVPQPTKETPAANKKGRLPAKST